MVHDYEENKCEASLGEASRAMGEKLHNVCDCEENRCEGCKFLFRKQEWSTKEVMFLSFILSSFP